MSEAALTQTLFSDGFEANLNLWALTGSCSRSSSAKSVGSYGARCTKTASMTATFSTTGFTNIRVTYARRVASYGSGNLLFAEWSPDGSTWTAIEQTAATSFSTPTFTLPAGAAGQAALRLRLRSNATGFLATFDADAVSVTGDTGPVCGDAVCNGTETCSTCAGDCGACPPPPVCGDAICNGTETCSTCAGDCGACAPSCGDHVCNGSETCSTCSGDCGVCMGADNPQVPGPYGVCYSEANISNSAYANPRLYYPCAPGSPTNGPIAAGVFNASTLSPGYTNAASVIFWLAEHVTSHGFVVLAMQPSNINGNNPAWRDAHVAAYNELIDENGRSGGPIYHAINTNKIQIMGFSKGGGGTLMAAQQLTSQGKPVGAVQALAPYYDSWSDVNLITAPTAIHCGSSDTIAPPASHGTKMFNGLLATTPRLLGIYSGLTHQDWYSGSGTIRYKMKQYITAWMKVYLDNNAAYQSYINGTNHQASWFTTYTYNP